MKRIRHIFLLLERVANARNWPDANCMLMLQSVLMGKVQEAYSSLRLEDSAYYSKIKSAVLQVYELIPEEYRHRFWSWERKNSQRAEFARDLSTHFKQWLTAQGVSTLEGLCDLMVVEQFRNCPPERVATYAIEQKVTTAADA